MNEMLNETLLERAKGLNGLLNAQAPRNEAAGRLTDETVDALHDAGITRMWLPRALGGYETWPTEALEVIEALCYADGSTGWVMMATQLSVGTAGAYLDPSAAKQIFAPGKRTPLIAGQGAPNGKAEVASGGYRLTTKGSYGSGLLHSSYFHTGSVVTEGGAPRMLPGTQAPDVRIFIVPIEKGELLGNWDVMGLRATGSVDYAITDVHVPEEYTHSLAANKAKQGGALYQLGISGFGNIGHSGFALGAARRALDELAQLANQPGGKPSNIAMGAGEGFQESFGAGEAQLRAARALLMDVHGDNEETLKRGDLLSVRQVTLSRLALNHVTTTAADICAMAFKFAGGAALRAGTLQRVVRDMMGGAQHITTSPFMLRECSKELMGAAKGKVWSLRGLIDPPK
ncbi:MAG: acyl-CoA dehydrogenase [Alphaproteobacteria bacterium]